MTVDPPREGRARPGRREEEGDRGHEQLKSLGRMSAELLHDLGSHLSVLEGRIAVARTEASRGRSTTGELGRLQRETRELGRMVRDILNHVRGVPWPGDSGVRVQPLLEDAIHRWLTGAPRVTPSLSIQLPTHAALPGPRSFYSRALGNLLRNAGRHARSQIRITARGLDDDRMLEVTVEDDGDGVDSEIRDHLFQPFVAGKEGEMGLGLAFTCWVAEELGGSVELAPEPGELGGALFRLRLPLNPPRPGPQSPPATRKASVLPPGLRVAIVDDDQSVRNVLKRRLEGEGAQVFTPSLPPPEEAGSLLTELADRNPQAILLDIHLGGISGLDLHETMIRRHPRLSHRVILITGGSLPTRKVKAPVLNKLTDWDDLLKWIGSVLPEDELG